MTSREKIAALRRLMKKQRIAAYIVPTEDPHLSEYVPERWKRRPWLTGFTGSAGDAVVTAGEAGLWTDSRYFLQAAQQLDGKAVRLFKVGEAGVPSIGEFLCSRLRAGQVVAADPRTFSHQRAEVLQRKLAEKGIALRFPGRNPVDAIWEDRPSAPRGPIVEHPTRFAGETAAAKLKRMRKALAAVGADAQVVAPLDEIAWLFNIRGEDVEFIPLVIAYAIVSQRGAEIFVDAARLTPAARRALQRVARVRSYREIGAALRRLAHGRARVLVDPETTNRWVVTRLQGARILFKPSPILRAKAVKNAVQIRGLRACHVRDGVAMVRFLHWMEGAARRVPWRETEAAARLDALRARGRYSRGISFASIVAFGPSGAIVHYRPIAGEDRVIGRRGILLLDTGGQYLDGTTDITRTITLGRPTRREQEYFTHVLRGHIHLSWTVFPQGERGDKMEALARQPLWFGGLTYGHGTGHGVGHYLSVHEGPVGFGRRSHVELEAGNVVTIEPGYYVAGRDGYRTENMVVVVPDRQRSRKGEPWLAFEPLTLCPIDRRLIRRQMLTSEERAWVDAYHARVYRKLSRHLSPKVRDWLLRATRPL